MGKNEIGAFFPFCQNFTSKTIIKGPIVIFLWNIIQMYEILQNNMYFSSFLIKNLTFILKFVILGHFLMGVGVPFHPLRDQRTVKLLKTYIYFKGYTLGK